MPTVSSLQVKIKVESSKAALALNKFKTSAVKSVRQVRIAVVQLNKSLGMVTKKISTLNRKANILGRGVGKAAADMKSIALATNKAAVAANKLSRSAKKVTVNYIAAGASGKTATAAIESGTRGVVRTNSRLLNQLAKIRRAYQLIRFGLRPFRAAVGVVTTLFIGLSVAIGKSVNHIDNLAKRSRLLGVPVENMQRLAFAADLAGVNFQTLTMGMQRMARRISQAAGVAKDSLSGMGDQKLFNSLRIDKIRMAEKALRDLRMEGIKAIGTERSLAVDIQIKEAQLRLKTLRDEFKETGEAAAAIKELGLDAKQLNKITADEQFLKIAKALTKIKNRNDQIRIAQKIWDSEGVRNVLVLSDALEKNVALFDKLGLGLTGKHTAAIESFKDSITVLSNVFSTIFNRAVAKLSPLLEHATERFVEFVTAGGGIEALSTRLAKGMGQFIGLTIKGFGFLIESGARFFAMLEKGALSVKKIFSSVVPTLVSGLFERFQSMFITLLKRLNSVVNKIPGFRGTDLFKNDIASAEVGLSQQKAITEEAAASGLKIDAQIAAVKPNQKVLEFAQTLGEVSDRLVRKSDELFSKPQIAAPISAPIPSPVPAGFSVVRNGSSFSDGPPVDVKLIIDATPEAKKLLEVQQVETKTREAARKVKN